MTSIRKYGFATVLAFATLSFLPTPASAEGPASGRFKLTHEVHWQNAVVPAGDYRFTYVADGASGLLTLTKISDPGAGFIFLVTDTDEVAPSGVSRLTLKSTADGSYVSTMLLPDAGMELHFAAPAHTHKQLARAATTVASAGQ
jgi:hypothetical protein